MSDKQVSQVGQGDTATPRNEEEFKARIEAKEAAKVNPSLPKAESDSTAEPEVVSESLPSARTEELDTPLAEETTTIAAAETENAGEKEEETPKKVDRPLDEEEAEAEEVRQELFPDVSEP